MPKTVQSFDPHTGAYAGDTVADEDQQSPGQFIMPAFATEEPVPPIPDGHVAFWRGDINGQPVAGKGWVVLRNEAPVAPVAEQDNEATKTARAEALAQAQLDGAARALGYDNILTAVTYADEPAVPKFQTEGQRLRRLRSLVWEECYSMLTEVQGGAPWPTEDEFLARLPTYEEMLIMEQGSGT
jgi:hypothetical protein